MGSLKTFIENRNYAFVVNLFDKKTEESDAEVRESAKRIRSRLGIIEQNENLWSKLFIGFYIIAALVFAIDFIKNPPETEEESVH
jgi:ABC-type histidine transport system ATPase subunit